jgi:hypothetical protein
VPRFTRIPLDKLPPRKAFGKAPKYTDADLAEATIALRAGVAISDGTDYDTRPAAHNAAGALRARLRKFAADLPTASQAIEHPADGDKPAHWTWAIRATAEQHPVTTVTTTKKTVAKH